VMHASACAPLYFPASQFVQLPAPEPDRVPAEQLSHADLSTIEDFPLVHMLQLPELALECIPSSQRPHAVASEVSL